MKRKSRGSATISLMIIIIIVGAVLLVGGIFPKTPQNTETPQEAILDQEAFTKLERKSLQLETLKFKQCAATAAVDFLADNSGSMQGSKLSDLKNGLKAFSEKFPDAGIVGLQAYNAPGGISVEGYKELVPISKMADVRTDFNRVIDNMGARGLTHSKDAMSFAKQKIDEGKTKFVSYRFNLVFISDGVPQTNATHQALCGLNPLPDVCSRTGSTCRCFAESQDPTVVAREIKNGGVRIFTIAYIDQDDAKFNTLLQNLMKNVASSPNDYYLAPVSNQIEGILAQIGQKLCE